MNLTTKGRYAVMALADMALQNTNSPVCLSDIATRQGITVNYLEQIFIKLRRAGIVDSVRGPGGGYIFAKDIKSIDISYIIKAVDEPIKMTKCISESHGAGGCMNKNAKCITHDLWHGLTTHINDYLSSVNLHDLCFSEKVTPLLKGSGK